MKLVSIPITQVGLTEVATLWVNPSRVEYIAERNYSNGTTTTLVRFRSGETVAVNCTAQLVADALNGDMR